jgi:hypothetical protein
VVTAADQAYGSYAGAIRERVGSCADYLGRISRVLDSHPDRRYVAGKAHELRDAAGRLVRTCHDVERWLRACGATILRHDGEDVWSEECTLESGHAGEHCAERPRTNVEEARDGADRLADASVELADELRWIAQNPRWLGDPDELEDLGRRYQELRRELDRLSGALAGLRLSPRRPFVENVDTACGPEEDELVCSECEFEAESVEQLAEHQREGCR